VILYESHTSSTSQAEELLGRLVQEILLLPKQGQHWLLERRR